jgi:hypothetical protein
MTSYGIAIIIFSLGMAVLYRIRMLKVKEQLDYQIKQMHVMLTAIHDGAGLIKEGDMFGVMLEEDK